MMEAKVFVSGFEENVEYVNANVIEGVFVTFGPIRQVMRRGPNYVIEFKFQEDAKAAIDNMHRSEMYGNVLSVIPAQLEHVRTAKDQQKAIWN